MANKRKQYNKEFKEEAIRYCEEHKELTNEECAKKLGIGESTLSKWKTMYRKESTGFRGSGNYVSEEAKEIARLRRELKNTEDALEILKKAIGILGE